MANRARLQQFVEAFLQTETFQRLSAIKVNPPLPSFLSLSLSLPVFISNPSCSLIEKRYSNRCSGEVFRYLISQLKRINCNRETREETNDLLALSLPSFLSLTFVYAFLWSSILGRLLVGHKLRGKTIKTRVQVVFPEEDEEQTDWSIENIDGSRFI